MPSIEDHAQPPVLIIDENDGKTHDVILLDDLCILVPRGLMVELSREYPFITKGASKSTTPMPSFTPKNGGDTKKAFQFLKILKALLQNYAGDPITATFISVAIVDTLFKNFDLLEGKEAIRSFHDVGILAFERGFIPSPFIKENPFSKFKEGMSSYVSKI